MTETVAGQGGAAPSSRRTIARHPNASVALGSGSGLGALVVWVVGLTGTTMPSEIGAVVGGLVAATALFIGRRGIRGALFTLWRGDEASLDSVGDAATA